MSYYDEATRQYAYNHGALEPEKAWILTPFDVWMPNPHYNGPAVPHPEDDIDWAEVFGEDKEDEGGIDEDEGTSDDWGDDIPY